MTDVHRHSGGTEQADIPAATAYLESRVREEAAAAAWATSLEATLAHVKMATAYAKRLNASNAQLTPPEESWVEEHRLW